MLKKIIDGFDFKPEESLIAGFLLYFFLFWTPQLYYIPLFDFFPKVMQSLVLPGLSFIALLGFLLIKKWRFLFLCMITMVFFLELNKYSSIFAFRYFPALVAVTYMILYKLDEDQKKIGASIILGCIFLFSAIHKMNFSYLKGIEFYEGGTFLIVFYKHFPNLIIPWGHFVGKLLAMMSIVIEILIGILMFRRPSIGIHFIIFFLLLLALFNSGVLFVYFFFLPLILLIKPDWIKKIKTLRYEKFLNNPLTLGGIFWFCQNYNSSFAKEFFTNTLWVFVLILLHVKFLLIEQKRGFCLEPQRVSFSYRLFLMPVILLGLFIGSYLFIPSPYGFKMFSAKRFMHPSHILMVNASNSCYILSQKIQFTPVVDAKIEFFYNNSCAIYFPTLSGLKSVIREVCLYDETSIMFLDKRRITCL